MNALSPVSPLSAVAAAWQADVVTVELPRHARAAHDARTAARSALTRWAATASQSEDVLLVVSELVTNAVQHARPPIVLTLSRLVGDKVWIAVTDAGPAPRPADDAAKRPPDQCGRGMAIVSALARVCGACLQTGLTTSWAEIGEAEPASRTTDATAADPEPGNEYHVTYEIQTSQDDARGVATVLEQAPTARAAGYQAADALMDHGWTITGHIATEAHTDSAAWFDPAPAAPQPAIDRRHLDRP